MKHILLILLILLTASCSENRVSRTEVSIVGEEFYINGNLRLKVRPGEG